jgi:type IV pilus assembly protein PilA
MKGKRYEGFSLIEILVVVALIIILAAITIIAINPAKNFRDTRNAQRGSDVNAILNAVTQYISEEGRTLASIGTIADCEDADGEPQPALATKIGTKSDGEPNEYINLVPKLVEGADLIVAIPVDPLDQFSDEDTGYTICATKGGRVQVAAPHTEGKGPITVKR